MSDVLGIVFLFIALFTLLGIIVLIISLLYEIFEEPNIQKQMRKVRKPVQPWVTVLLYSHNNENLIGSSLKALLRSHYHNFDIVVVNDYSNDSKNALKKGYSKSLKGEIVLSIHAGVIVPASFIKRAVAIKGNRKQLTMRISAQLNTSSFIALAESLSSLVWQRAHKVKVCDSKNIATIKMPGRFDYLFVLLFAVIIVTSLVMHEPIIVWYSWLIVTGYLFAIIWLKDEKIKTKRALTFSAFSAFFILPATSVVMFFYQLSSRNLRI